MLGNAAWPTTLQSLNRPVWSLSVDTSSKQAAVYKRLQVKYNID
jgi:hypothetical protein